jgi:hypothetical protein
VLDEYRDDDRDYFVDRINKILSKYSCSDFAEMYSLYDALGLLNIFDKNDDDTIKD